MHSSFPDSAARAGSAFCHASLALKNPPSVLFGRSATSVFFLHFQHSWVMAPAVRHDSQDNPASCKAAWSSRVEMLEGSLVNTLLWLARPHILSRFSVSLETSLSTNMVWAIARCSNRNILIHTQRAHLWGGRATGRRPCCRGEPSPDGERYE